MGIKKDVVEWMTEGENNDIEPDTKTIESPDNNLIEPTKE